MTMSTRIETRWAVTFQPVGKARWTVVPVALPLELAEASAGDVLRQEASVKRCEALPLEWLVRWSEPEGRS